MERHPLHQHPLRALFTATGALYDRTGSYTLSIWLAIALSLLSIACVWLAAPRKVRVVAGQVARLHAQRRSQGQEQTA